MEKKWLSTEIGNWVEISVCSFTASIYLKCRHCIYIVNFVKLRKMWWTVLYGDNYKKILINHFFIICDYVIKSVLWQWYHHVWYTNVSFLDFWSMGLKNIHCMWNKNVSYDLMGSFLKLWQNIKVVGHSIATKNICRFNFWVQCNDSATVTSAC